MLPELQLPAGLPCFLVQGHNADVPGPYDDVDMAAGSNRRRRVFTTAPREVDVQMILEAAQSAALRAWWEGPAQAGALTFAAHVRNQGPGMRWWEAMWVQPYALEGMHKGRWRLSGRLRLYGAPSTSPPTRTSMAARISVPFQGAGTLSVGRPMAASILATIDAAA
jgi:hypothetical protein